LAIGFCLTDDLTETGNPRQFTAQSTYCV